MGCRHFSFDLWLTLIKSNPTFKLRRDEMFHSLFNPKELSLEEVSAIVRKVDINSNRCCEVTHLHVPVERMIYDILQELEVSEAECDNYAIEIAKKRIQTLFMTYPPTLYDDNTVKMLKRLFDSNYTLNILSNTGFILGSTLDLVLTNLGIRKYFQFAIYSDQECIAKPNSFIFEKVIAKANYPAASIIHVGDNAIADGACTKVGIKYFQINSNTKSIKDLI